MIKHALVAVLLFSSAGYASAATLNYYGQYYTEASGSGPTYGYGFGPDAVGRSVFPDGYNEGMRVEISLELDKPLGANETLDIDPYYSSANAPEILSFSASDGLYTRTDEEPGFVGLTFYGWMQTDEFGHVSAWDLFLYNGSAADYDAFGTSSADGDYAVHQREYATYDPEHRISGVSSRASVDNPGVWLYGAVPVPAPIPVPASLPLVLSGIGLLGLVRRRSQRG